MTTKEDLVGDFGRLGICDGDTIMVHASLKAIGPVDGGPAMIVEALVDAVGQRGNLLAYVSWDRSPYEETLSGRRLSDAEREAWPAFDPATAGTYRGFGVLNDFICGYPGAWRSAHPDASMAAIGPRASELVRPHRLGDAYGPGSPLERFVSMRGRVLMLGAPLDAVTVLHLCRGAGGHPGQEAGHLRNASSRLVR